MKPQTIKNILTFGAVAGVITIMSGDWFDKAPKKPKEVVRLEEIGHDLIRENYSISDIANLVPSIESQIKGNYDRLISEKEVLVDEGVYDKQKAYNMALNEHHKRFQRRALLGTVIAVPCILGLLYDHKKREEESTA